MRNIPESYRRIGEDEGRFDIEFWQRQGEQAIFNAALEMILDYLMIRTEHADQPGLQRDVESYGKIDLGTLTKQGASFRAEPRNPFK